ncbi:MAG: transcription elongation factor GreA [Fibrobacterota bacterium]
MDTIYMTQEGYGKLKERLTFLMTTKRREIGQDMEHARGFGDLSENAEYDAAREKLDVNEREIRTLTETITTARVLDDSKIAKDKAFLGARIKIKDLTDNEVVEYQLVSPPEADIDANKISVASPLGKALLGKGVGEAVGIQSPRGARKYKILTINR